MVWKKLGKQEAGSESDFVKWRNPGQSIEGTWKGKKEGKFGYFGILKQGGEDVLFSMPTVLANNLDDVPEGINVKIVYLGKKEGKSGHSYHDFEVYQEEL